MSNTNPKGNLADVTADGLTSYGQPAKSLASIRKEREAAPPPKAKAGQIPYAGARATSDMRQMMGGNKPRGR